MTRNDAAEIVLFAMVLGLGIVVWYLAACTLFVLLGN